MITVFMGLSLLSQVTYLLGMIMCWIVAISGARKIMREKMVTSGYTTQTAKRSDVIKHLALYVFSSFVPGGNIIVGGTCLYIAVTSSKWWNKPL